MSIEKALADLTAAVEKNSSLLAAMMKNAPATAGTKAAGATTAATKPAGGKPAPKKKTPTEEDIRNAFGGYMSGAKDKAERAERKENVAAIIAHFGVERATDIPEESRAEALGYIKQFEEGETPDFMNEGDGDGDDGDDGDDSLL